MANQFLELLHQEHEKVKSTFEQLQMSTGSSTQKQQLFNSLKMDLSMHMTGEEKYFYPALQQKAESKENALEGFEEHHVAKGVLKELESTGMQDEHWSAKLTVLKELVDHHVEEEEGKIFSDAEKYLSSQQLQGIMTSYQNEKKSSMR